MTTRFTHALAATAVAATLAVGLAGPAGADEAKVNQAISRVDNLAALAPFAPCSTVREKFNDYGGQGLARTRGDLQARSGGVINGQVAQLRRQAGGLTAGQESRYRASLNNAASVAISRAVACGVVNGSQAVTNQAPAASTPAPASNSPAPAPRGTSQAPAPAPQGHTQAPAPAPAPVPAPAPAPGTTWIPNPLDPAHPFVVPFPLPPQVAALSSGRVG